jgi:hypothetical protein
MDLADTERQVYPAGSVVSEIVGLGDGDGLGLADGLALAEGDGLLDPAVGDGEGWPDRWGVGLPGCRLPVGVGRTDGP